MSVELYSWLEGLMIRNEKGSLIIFFKCALSFVFSFSYAFVQIPTVTAEFHVNTNTGRIEDNDGRERLFHGLNVVMKGPPWHPHIDAFDPRSSFSEADIELLRDWGMNSVRLAVMWPGVEPTKGNVNATYLKIMTSIVRKLHAAGIFTLIEFHQDLFTSQFCGEGIPGWVLSCNLSDHIPPNPFDPNKNILYSFHHKSLNFEELKGLKKPPWRVSSPNLREISVSEDMNALETADHGSFWSHSRDLDRQSFKISSTMSSSNPLPKKLFSKTLLNCERLLRESFLYFPDNSSESCEKHYSQESRNQMQETCGSLNWFWNYFSYAVSKAFQDLYDNRRGWTDLLAHYWKVVAEAFKEEAGVLGYELMNEPWAGNVYRNPLLLLPGVADKINLTPFYEKLQAAVRSVDSEKILFFESLTFDDILCGFSDVPGGELFRNRSVLSYHYYRPPNLSPKQVFRERLREGRRLGCGTMLTEFFVNKKGSKSRWLSQKQHEFLHYFGRLCVKRKLCNQSLPFVIKEINHRMERLRLELQTIQSKNLIDEMNGGKESVEDVLAASDRYVQSWIGWEYKAFLNKTGSDINESLFTADGNVNLNLAKKLARTYPQAVAGRIVSFSFDPVCSNFSLVYVVGKFLHGEAQLERSVSVNIAKSKKCTEIFVHRTFHYPLGLEINVSHDCLDVKEEERIITICHRDSCLGKIVEVAINRKNV